MYKKIMTNLSLPCCLLNSQYIDLSELIHVLKVVTVVASEHLKPIDDFCSQSLFDC